MTRPISAAVTAILFALFMVSAAPPARAASDEQELVDKSRLTIEKLVADKAFGTMKSMLEDAKGVLIIPSLLKGAFIFGAEGGSGVLLARTENGGWSYPAFYTMGGGSVGFQIGAQASEVVLLLMNEGALSAVMKNQIKLGADVSAAIGPVGAGIEGSTTTNLNADVVAFSSNAGLFGGISLEGSVINGRESHNEAYYGSGATAHAILVEGKLVNHGADALRAFLASTTPKK
ncbi:MAG: lipid-binding SYLF domain-containing protein [Alphaproteobacteria bacterium]